MFAPCMCHVYAMCVPWVRHGPAMGPLCICHVLAVGLPKVGRTSAMGFYGCVMGEPRIRHNNAPGPLVREGYAMDMTRGLLPLF